MDFFNLLMRILVTISVGFITVHLISIFSIRLKPPIKPIYYKMIIAFGFGITAWITMYTSLFIVNIPAFDAKFYIIAITGVLVGPFAGLITLIMVIGFSLIFPIQLFTLPVMVSSGITSLIIGSSLSGFIRKNYTSGIWIVIILVTITSLGYIYFLSPTQLFFDLLQKQAPSGLIYFFLSGSVISYIYYQYYHTKENIENLKKQAQEEQNKKEEIFGLYEQITAQEEELRANYLEVKDTKESLELRDKRLQNLYEVSQEGFWEVDIENNQVYFTNQLNDIFGYEKKELEDLIKKPQNYAHPDFIDRIKQDIKYLKQKPHGSFNNETLYRKKNGDYIWIEVNWVANYNQDGLLTYMTGSFKNIHKEKLIQNDLYEAAFHDSLTKIPNRNAFTKKLNEVLSDCLTMEAIPEIFGAVIIIDLDNFKWLNDSFGHSFGDQLLIEVVKRLLNTGDAPHAVLTRLGGDEFAIILKEYFDFELIYNKVMEIQSQFSVPFQMDGTEIQVNPSAGVVLFPKDGSSVEEILKHADTALNEAKNRGKNQFVFFNEQMAHVANKRMALELNLRKAIRGEKFNLVYQPQYSIRQNQMVGVEALLRWWNPELGHVSPAEFIPLAEANGLINELGEWTMKQAFQMAKKLNQNRDMPLIMSINISPHQLQKAEFVDRTIKIAGDLDVDPRWITLEITETALMNSFKENIQKIQSLLSYGFNFALDDFGTGYSSLSYLLRIPSKLLKIDRSFIKDLPTSEKHKRLVKTIIEIAHDLRMDVMAEGVETEEQLGILQLYECDFLQGYLYNKPLPEKDLLHLIDLEKPDQLTS